MTRAQLQHLQCVHRTIAQLHANYLGITIGIVSLKYAIPGRCHATTHILVNSGIFTNCN